MTISIVAISSDVTDEQISRIGQKAVRDLNGDLFAVVETTASGARADIWKSTDDGETWTLATSDSGIGGASPGSTAESQIAVDRIDGALLLFRREGSKGQVFMHSRTTGGAWTAHGAIFGHSGSVFGDATDFQLIIDYASSSSIGSPARTTSRIHFYYRRVNPSTDRILYQNSRFGGGEDTIVITNEVTYHVGVVDPVGFPKVALLREPGAAPDYIQWWERPEGDDMDTPGSTWTSETVVQEGTAFVAPLRLESAILRAADTFAILFSEGNRPWIAEGVNWDTEQIKNDAVTPTISSSLRSRLSDTTGNKLHAFLERGAGANQVEVWQQVSANNWGREIPAENTLLTQHVSAIYLGHLDDSSGSPLLQPAAGMFVVGFESGTPNRTYSLFRSGEASWTPEEEPRPECAAQPTRASVVLTGEGSSAGAIPISPPDFVYAESTQWFTEAVRFETGHRARVSRFPDSRKRMRLRFSVLTEAERDSLLAFLDARSNSNEAFTFTLPDDETTITAVAVQETVIYRKRAPGVYAVEFDAEELII